MTTSVAIIGGGRLGTSIGKYLIAAGYRITGVCCRTADSARRSGAILHTDNTVTTPWEITLQAQLVLITTPDGEIAKTYKSIVNHNGFSPGTTVIHCSGSHPSTILTASGDTHIAKGSFHPLQSFAAADKAEGNPFSGIIAAIEGDDQALAMARQMGQALGTTCFPIKTEAKIMYHAAAVVASNYLVTIIDMAFSFLASAGISRQDAVSILYPLIEGTLSNIKSVGPPAALTGPIARGDAKTIADHLQHIQAQNKDLLEIYSQLGMQTVNLAAERGSLSPSQVDALRQLLGDALTG